MKLLSSLAVLALTSQVVVSEWFGTKAIYNKWHETELERWLSDHDVPYPTPADRKDLEDLVGNNWNDYIVKPYQAVAGSATDTTADAYGNVQDWIFDTWTESQLKSFLDYHSIPNPSPRTRDSLLSTVRSNYAKAADKAGETFAYPGDWIYQSWSDSDAKAWLDERGIPVPQPSTRDKLIASLRRNSRVAGLRASSAASSASASAASAQESLSDTVIAAWGDSELKAFLDRSGVKVPQGSKRNELLALARKHAAALTGNNPQSSASSAYGAATSSAGNIYAQATNDVYAQARHYYDYALNQFGFASAEAAKSLSSASSVASVEASKSSVAASKSASSAGNWASKSASSASSLASKSASSASKVAASSLSSARNEL